MKINHRNNALGKEVIQQIFGYIKDNKCIFLVGSPNIIFI